MGETRRASGCQLLPRPRGTNWQLVAFAAEPD
jgi:hypothetical protein